MIADAEVVLRRGEDDLPLCREAIEHAATVAGFSGNELGDVVAAVFEACVNAVEHGQSASGEPPTLRVRVLGDRLEAVVRDSGKGLDHPHSAPLPSPTVPHGRGIALMRLYMDEVKFDNDNGLRVTLIKYIR